MQPNWLKLKQSPYLWLRYLQREKITLAIREFFKTQQFHEVEVPLLAPNLPAESYVEVFETILLNRLKQKKQAFLTTSPEMFLKKLLVAGIGNCYSLCKSFRNTEDMSEVHNPEFTILEWYRVNVNYTQVMKDVENLLGYVCQFLYSSKEERSDELRSFKKSSSHIRSNNNMIISYQGQIIDLTPPWTRISMVEAFAKFAHINLIHALNLKVLMKLAKDKGYQVDADESYEELFNRIYLNEVVPNFPKTRPIVIYDYPIQLVALAAKPKENDPRFCERFEVYIAGIELADGCSELTDVKEQQKRFAKELKIRKKLNKTDYPVDTEFIEALKLGLPKCTGIALGIDRLMMLLTDVARIQDTLFFPASEMWKWKKSL